MQRNNNNAPKVVIERHKTIKNFMHKQQTDDEIIYSYTDEEAQADGVLQDFSLQQLFLPVNGKLIFVDRVTGNLMAEMPQDTSHDTMAGYLEQAILTADTSDEGLIKLELPHASEVWLMPNERNHYTAMLPSDY